MGYSPKSKLADNIASLKIALAYKAGQELSVEAYEQLRRYSGFGGIKTILYGDGDIADWKANGATVTDIGLYGQTQELFGLLRSSLGNWSYRVAVSSLQESVLTSFYTPNELPNALFQAIQQSGIEVNSMYEPSAGAGIFITSAQLRLEGLKQITAVEKDFLTSKVLQAIADQQPCVATVHNCGFEETSKHDNATYDLVTSNIPFGNFAVDDPSFSDRKITGRIHNYFFAKGMDKVRDGGLLAYLTTDAFLNSPSNSSVREYIFKQADFISLIGIPDEFMKDSGTSAPTHLLLVQKNLQKRTLSAPEAQLVDTVALSNEFGNYHINDFLHNNRDRILGKVQEGKNQYGKANLSVSWDGPIEHLYEPLKTLIGNDLNSNFNRELYQRPAKEMAIKASAGKRLTLREMPIVPSETVVPGIQLGLFDIGPAAAAGQAMAYLSAMDERVVQKATARIISSIKTTDHPEHAIVVLIAAKGKQSHLYKYRTYSNVDEINCSQQWLNAAQLSDNLVSLSNELAGFAHHYLYHGDEALRVQFRLDHPMKFSYEGKIKEWNRDGMIMLHNGQLGRLTEIDHESGAATFISHASELGNSPFYESYIQLRNSYHDMLQIQQSDERDAARMALNSLYDAFVLANGQLNSSSCTKLIMEDRPFGLKVISSLERRNGKGLFVKADVLTAKLEKTDLRLSTDDPFEALARCLNDRGRVDIGYIAELTGQQEQSILHRLSESLFLNPQSDTWETSEDYLSGNVVEKLRTAQQYLNDFPENGDYRSSVAALEKVQPAYIPFELLDFNLGERWIPNSIYADYTTQLLDTATRILYIESLDAFKVDYNKKNTTTDNEYAVQPRSGNKMYAGQLVEHALENTTPYFSYEVNDELGNTIRVPDTEAIQLAHQKVEAIRTGFITYLNQLPREHKDKLASHYNETFNCFRLREYDGSHLTFPGLDRQALGISDLFTSQVNAAWRIIQNRGGLIDHEVGLGKTLTMIIASQELKRLGLAHKPLILALKANIGQIRDTFKLAYPNARLVAPEEEDFTPERRLRIFHEIANNNVDCIILTHDQFGKIPQSLAIQSELLQVEIDHLELDLETVRKLGGDISKKSLKGLQIRKKNLEAKLSNVQWHLEKRKDHGIDFVTMGIDHLLIDESHKFKNLTYTTRHSRVGGLGNTDGSQKALNMLFAIRTLQQKFDMDCCATFLSGTPISNSLTELYLIFKYLTPKEMERQRIANFDGWAAVYARKSAEFEFGVTNQIIMKERFRQFIKVPELAVSYNRIADFKTAKHIAQDRPTLIEKLVPIKPTPLQEEYIIRLMRFAENGDGTLIGRPPLGPDEIKAKMLIATNFAKKLAVDIRLIDPSLPEEAGNKISRCSENVLEIFNRTKAFKGTQLIFCDIGTPGTAGFNVYAAMKQKLVENGIPSNEIAFIHDFPGKRKKELFRKMNTGEIRVLMGSTEKLGTGNNVQRLAVADHHLDVTWKSTDLDQRNGRIERPDNIAAKQYQENKVYGFYYATERTLDIYMFNVVKNKQVFISQLKDNKLQTRILDEGAMDESNGMNFAEYIAILSGDTSLLEKAKIDKKIASLESLKKAHYKEDSQYRTEMDACRSKLATDQKWLDAAVRDSQVFKKYVRYNEDGSMINAIVLNGIKSGNVKDIGTYLFDLSLKEWKNRDECIGSLYGVKLFIDPVLGKPVYWYGTEVHRCNLFYAKSDDGLISYRSNNGRLSDSGPQYAARYFLNAISNVENIIKHYQKEIGEQEKRLAGLQGLVGRPFTRERELELLKQDTERLTREITMNLNKINGGELPAVKTEGPPIGLQVVPNLGKQVKMEKKSRNKLKI